MKNDIVKKNMNKNQKIETYRNLKKIKLHGVSIKTKILISVSILIGITITVSLLFFSIEYRNYTKVQILNEHKILQEKIISDINRWVEVKLQIFQIMQYAVIEHEKTPDFYLSLFKHKIADDKDIISLYYASTSSVDGGGYLINAEGWIYKESNDLQDTQWFKETLFSRKIIITSPYLDTSTNAIILTMAFPVIKDDVPIGIIAIDCNINSFIKILKENSESTKSVFHLITEDGMFINHNDPLKILNSNELLFNDSNFKFEKSFIVNQTVSAKFLDRQNIFYASHKIPNMPLLLITYGHVSDIYSSLYTFILKTVAGSIFAIIVAILILSVIMSIFTKALSPVALIVKEIAEGGSDLTVRIKSKAKDEIGTLVQYFNDFLTYFNTMFKDIKSHAEKMTEAQTAVTSSVQETSAAVHEVSSSLNQINDNLKYQNTQINKSVNNVNKLITDIHTLSEYIFSQSSLIEQSSASIQELTKSMDNVANFSINAKKISNDLESTSKLNEKNIQLLFDQIQKTHNYFKQISDIVKIINDVAEQTDLLAMNAAIEAAHAGDKGSGFALVAEEIRNLSETVSFQSNEIKTIVEQVSSEIDLSVDTSTETMQSLKKVIEGVTQNNSIVAQISVSTSEQAKGGQEILQSIRELNEITGKINTIVSGEKLEIQSINKVNTDLVSFTDEITNSIDQQTSALQYINRAMADIANKIDSLKSISAVIISFIEKFRTT